MNWKEWWLTYFDWNGDGVTNWWEYLIPFVLLIGIEVIAELVANLIVKSL
jgi:hypothetical protein